MLYQKLLVGADPYFICIGPGAAFELHRHPEIELSYCLKGSYTITIDQKQHCLSEGDLAVVNPMAAHELGQCIGEGLRLTIEVGPGLLGEQFNLFISMNPDDSIFRLKHDKENTLYVQLTQLLEETVALLETKPHFYNLTLKGNLYKISAILLQLLAITQAPDTVLKSLADIEKVDRAINVIYDRYNEPLSLDAVSALCGYSKSNFCKVFKSVTGDSFHNMLNRHRVGIACLLLTENAESIEEIALGVGFSDAKSFCRTFKKFMGKTASEYRKG